MYKEVKTQKDFIEHHKFCDVCGVEISMGLECSAAQCQICRKDLCENCIGTEKDTMGDYREVWCTKCWAIGEKYRPAIKELYTKYSKLYDDWYNECKQEENKNVSKRKTNMSIKLCVISKERCVYWDDEDTKIFCNTCPIAERYEAERYENEVKK